MKAWWAGLSTREQALIALAAGVFALFLLMQIVIGPVADWRSAAADRAEQAANEYRMVARAAAAAPMANAANAAAATSARTALIETARRLNVNLTFVNEHEDGSIEFQAGPVPPEQAFKLFSTLERNFAINIAAADVARSPDTPANVRVQATLTR